MVEVHYDPTVVSYEALVKQAAAKKCAAPVFTRSDAQHETAKGLVGKRAVRNDDGVRTDDDKYYLSRTVLKHLPMTPIQAAHVNAWVKEKEDPTPLLSPSQVALLETIRSKPDAEWPVAIGVDFLEAWQRAQAQANPPR